MTHYTMRWAVKKAARAAAGLGGLWIVGEEARARLRVLTYHRFGESPGDVFCLPPGEFENHVRWIAEANTAVSIDDVCDHLATGKSLPAGALLVTIDDGHLSTWTHARPILSQYAVPAVAFVTSNLIGRGDSGGGTHEPYMNWEQLARLRDSGIAIGSHAANHRSMGLLPLDQAREEIDSSRCTLEERAETTVRSFAYPFGTRIDCTRETGRLVAEAGYDCAFTSQHGAILAGLDPFLLPRVKIESGDGNWHFRRACRGAMDSWRFVDSLMWRLQQHRTETVVED